VHTVAHCTFWPHFYWPHHALWLHSSGRRTGNQSNKHAAFYCTLPLSPGHKRHIIIFPPFSKWALFFLPSACGGPSTRSGVDM
jgi:hypothetical protein